MSEAPNIRYAKGKELEQLLAGFEAQIPKGINESGRWVLEEVEKRGEAMFAELQRLRAHNRRPKKELATFQKA